MANDGPFDDHGPFEEVLDPPPTVAQAEIRAGVERGIADIVAGRVIEGDVFLAELRMLIAELKAKRRQADGPPIP